MTSKVSKSKINKTCVSGKNALWLVQHGIKTGADLDSLLNYVKSLELITYQLKSQLKEYKGGN